MSKAVPGNYTFNLKRPVNIDNNDKPAGDEERTEIMIERVGERSVSAPASMKNPLLYGKTKIEFLRRYTGGSRRVIYRAP